MSEQEFKPGDVITIDETPMFVVEVTANSRAAWGEGLHAVDADGNGRRVSSLYADSPRRLAAIDWQNRGQVERLLASLTRMSFSPHACGAFACLQQVLRESANPTPKEPSDPAVRVWANGSEWAKVGPWWVTPAVNEVPRDWDYLVESVGFHVLGEVTP